jgi:hypothetical protein
MEIKIFHSKQHFNKINAKPIILFLLTIFLSFSLIQTQEVGNTTETLSSNNTVNISENIDINSYKDFNLTKEIEKEFDEKYANDKAEDYYKNVEKVKSEKKKKKQKKVDVEQEKEFKEWEEKIQSFTPEELITMMVGKGDHEVLYQDVAVVPTRIIVAFYVHDEDSKIDFEIYNPNGKINKKIKGKNRGFHEFNVTMPGSYEFVLNNERVRKRFFIILFL